MAPRKRLLHGRLVVGGSDKGGLDSKDDDDFDAEVDAEIEEEEEDEDDDGDEED